jgi:hypothetical protein
VLLGKNPGFDKDAAGRIAAVTAAVALRLDLLPEGVAQLLRRWMRLQLAELAFVSGSGSNGDADAIYGVAGAPETTVRGALRANGHGPSRGANLDVSHMSADPYSIAATDPADPFLNHDQMQHYYNDREDLAAAGGGGGDDNVNINIGASTPARTGTGLGLHRKGNLTGTRAGAGNGFLFIDSELDADTRDDGNVDRDSNNRDDRRDSFEYAIPTPPARGMCSPNGLFLAEVPLPIIIDGTPHSRQLLIFLSSLSWL